MDAQHIAGSGYYIYRSTVSGGPYAKLNTTLILRPATRIQG